MTGITLDRGHLIWTLAVVLLSTPAVTYAQLQHFITTRGDRLMDGDKELRFVSYNIPNLHYIEDNHQFTEPNPWRPADEFEIRDALTSIHQMGGKVTRLYVPSVRKAIDDPRIPRHVDGPGVFNEAAFKAYDRVLAIANETGVRVIIPFVDNWWWWGGPKEHAAFRGKAREAFWTDSTIIEDFKKTIAFIVNRVNTITGVPYKDDMAILGWETGNELEPPFTWTRQIAAYIKTLDRNHLVIEGTHSKVITEDALADPNLDVLSTHHYTPTDETIRLIIAAREKSRGRKPYFVGEFGFMPTPDMRRVIDTVAATGVSGIMVWSLRGHNRDGGFYYHGNSYRWPGFASGDSYDERAVIQLFRQKAFEINGLPVEPVPPPGPPRILPTETPYAISWQGSTGAASYIIERRSELQSWTVIAPAASDADIGYRPLYSDTSVSTGKAYWYRIRASNPAGTSEPSDELGPLTASAKLLIDELRDRHALAEVSAGIRFLPVNDAAKAKEDLSRAGGNPGDYLLYRVPGAIVTITLDVFFTKPEREQDIQILTGPDADHLASLAIDRSTLYPPTGNEYGAYTPARYILEGAPPGDRIMKIIIPGNTQVGRVEIMYGAASLPGGQ